jgi:hypothetical protein
MSRLDLSGHTWVAIASLLPVLVMVLRRCQKMGLNPLLPLAGVVGGFWLELKRSGGNLPNVLPPSMGDGGGGSVG